MPVVSWIAELLMEFSLSLSPDHRCSMSARPRPALCRMTRIVKPCKSVPEYDPIQLNDRFREYTNSVGVAKAFDFGIYSTHPRSHAVSEEGLLHNEELVMAVLDVTPQAELLYVDLKNMMKFVYSEYPKIKTKPDESVDQFAGDVADKIMAILKHARTLKISHVRMRQACKLLEGVEEERLCRMLAPMTLEMGGGSKANGPEEHRKGR